jgi:hypothetical protein
LKWVFFSVVFPTVRPENPVLAGREKVTTVCIAECGAGKGGAAGEEAAKEIKVSHFPKCMPLFSLK